MHDILATEQQLYKTNLDYIERKYESLFQNMVEIGNGYNGICTSYGKCIHGIGNELLLRRATAARMTNQIEFIINHITSQPDYIKNTGLFEAFQENQAKWAEVEAGIYDKYIRGEGTISPVTQNLTWDRDNLRYEESQCNDTHDITSMDNPPPTPDPAPHPEPYEAPEPVTIDLSRNTGTPSPPPRPQTTHKLLPS
jgi:hypothetical protein